MTLTIVIGWWIAPFAILTAVLAWIAYDAHEATGPLAAWFSLLAYTLAVRLL